MRSICVLKNTTGARIPILCGAILQSSKAGTIFPSEPGIYVVGDYRLRAAKTSW